MIDKNEILMELQKATEWHFRKNEQLFFAAMMNLFSMMGDDGKEYQRILIKKYEKYNFGKDWEMFNQVH